MKKYTVYAASCTKNGGIYKYALSDSGRLTSVSSIHLDRPMYFIKKGDALHTLLRAPEGLGGNSGYLKVKKDLSAVTEPTSTEGIVACHLAVTDEGAYVTNYLSGSVTKIGKRTVVHKKTEHNREGRQDMPHTHFVAETPDGKYLAVCDLGLDKVILYDKELNYVSECSVPDGAGARHLVFSPDGRFAYVANELDSTVSVLRYEGDGLRYVRSYSCEPKTEKNYPAAIRLSPDGERLYVSQRGDDAVSVFNVDGETLTLERSVPTYGASPRDIFLTPDGRFLLCANEGGFLTVLDTERDFALTDSVELPSALCVIAE